MEISILYTQKVYVPPNLRNEKNEEIIPTQASCSYLTTERLSDSKMRKTESKSYLLSWYNTEV